MTTRLATTDPKTYRHHCHCLHLLKVVIFLLLLLLAAVAPQDDDDSKSTATQTKVEGGAPIPPALHQQSFRSSEPSKTTVDVKEGDSTERKLRSTKAARDLQGTFVSGGDEVYMWCTAGNGLRSMTGSMGFANLLEQILEDRRRRRLQRFDDVNSNTAPLWLGDFYSFAASGEASWFALPFFYSDQFRERTLDTPNELRSFLIDWMNVYLDLNSNLPKSADCQVLQEQGTDKAEGRVKRQQCDLLLEKYGGSWANFVQDVFRQTSSKVYNDPGFERRTADGGNRGWLLKQVNMFIQSTLLPQSQVRGLGKLASLTRGTSNDVYSVGIPTQYSVKDDGTAFYMASLDQSSMVKVGVGLAPRQFSSGAFSSYYQYPASNGRILTTPTTNLDQSQRFVDPFGGTATVSQAAAIGSAYWHSISGSSPSSLAQYLSAETYDVRQETRMLATAAAAALYESRSFDDLAVCSQWPNPCGISDGRFVSGDFSDSFGLASSIGQYHQEGNSPQRSRLKVIVTYNNFHEWNNMRLRAYFETDFNALVSPGGFVWPPPENPKDSTEGGPLPMRSPQIFSEYLDEQTIRSSLNYERGPFDKKYAFAEFIGTTIENKAYGVKANQRVSILYIRTNSIIPSDILGRKRVNDWKQMIPIEAQDIAEDDTLRSVVTKFLEATDSIRSYCDDSPNYTCWRYGFPECCFYSPGTCPVQTPPCDKTADYCTYSPDYDCYIGGWPQCCLDNYNAGSCPSQPPPCNAFTYCNWQEDFRCYEDGYPACCRGVNPAANCPKQQPPCDQTTDYCLIAANFNKYENGWPACCFLEGPQCPRDPPSS